MTLRGAGHRRRGMVRPGAEAGPHRLGRVRAAGCAGHADTTRDHTFRSITASIARAQETLGYAPRYTALEALHEALAWLVAHGQADVGGQDF